MNRCIYLNETDDTQEFKKEEHIFPAGIGGIKKLPIGYVSDYVNGIVFSKMELGVMRESIIAIPRMFEGPGKRGSLTIKNESKSKISTFKFNDEENKVSLGYIKKGKPYQIPQIAVSVGENKLECDIILDSKAKNVSEEREEFLKKLSNLDQNTILKILNDNGLNKGDFVLGVFENKWYMIANDYSLNLECIKDSINKIVEEYRKGNINKAEKCGQVTVNIGLAFNIKEFYRISAKIAFNYLAYVKGQEFVLDKQFDTIRKFILGVQNHANIQLIDKVDFPIKFPDECHMINVLKEKESLCAVISYYGGFPTVFIELCNNYKNSFDDIFGIGYICDWRNKKEYRLAEYIDKYCNDADNLDIENSLHSKINY